MTRTLFSARWAIVLPLAVLLTMILAADVAQGSHGSFTVSEGTYRVPYADDLTVTAFNDHHNHPGTLNRVDIGVGGGNVLVAAASGFIRGIVDNHGNDYGRDDGVDINGDPQDGALEDNCSGDGDSSNVTGGCATYNNYVWIEHDNGEWTKYSHPQTGTVTINYGWSVGDRILAGQPLGLEGRVGAASGNHLHFEVAVPTDPTDPTPFSTNGGFIQGTNVVTQVCFVDGDANNDGLYTDGESYTAGPCTNQAPTADAGGPYVVDEGSTVQLDGTGSSDIHNDAFSYSWSPSGNLDDSTLAMPTYSGIDDEVINMTLTITELSAANADIQPGDELSDDDTTTVTVLNVPPTVTAVGDSIDEAGTATVSATFTDPGTADTHTATIDWDDGTPPEAVTVAQLATGVDHIYGDNGVYTVEVTVIDDDGGQDSDDATVTVGNLDPSLVLDTSDEVVFPGGSYMIVEAGAELPSSAEGSDPGSDDLTFTWSVADVNTYFNDGIGPDPAKSPLGTFPFQAADGIDALYAEPGVELLSVVLTDDDGGSDDADAGVIVTGTADDTEDLGWWKHQYSGEGKPHLDGATAGGYLEIVNAVSGVFSESTNLATTDDAHDVLSPEGNDPRGRAEADLLLAWLQFASGAVHWDATVPLGGKDTIGFLDLMFEAEATILDGSATKEELKDAELDLARVRHAS